MLGAALLISIVLEDFAIDWWLWSCLWFRNKVKNCCTHIYISQSEACVVFLLTPAAALHGE